MVAIESKATLFVIRLSLLVKTKALSKPPVFAFNERRATSPSGWKQALSFKLVTQDGRHLIDSRTEVIKCLLRNFGGAIPPDSFNDLYFFC